MLVDSHCHLNLLDGATDAAVLANYVQAARANDVGCFLCVATDMETLPAVLQAAEQHADVYASVGVHPNHNAGHEPGVEELIAHAQHPKVIAIGETGLDYYRTQGDVRVQQERLRRHIAAAKAVSKPLIIHTREARADTLRILEEEGAQQARGVMHCFTEDWATAKRALDIGFYISFSGIVTFRNAVELQAVAQQVPMDRILIETDAPWLAPMPHRGKPNQPAYVRHVAEFIATLRQQDYAGIAAQTTHNFQTLFGVPACKGI
ncbi:MAG: TatD family hydrolase [Pseudomonadota bacterium]